MIRKYKVVVALKSVSRWVTPVVSHRRFNNLFTDNGTKRAYREWNTAFGDGQNINRSILYKVGHLSSNESSNPFAYFRRLTISLIIMR